MTAPVDALEGDAESGAGQALGKYQLIRRVAIGGMAELFLARASAMHGFEKLVVLKRILPQHAENEKFTRMFLDEARLAAKLDHPNIAQVYDIGEADDGFFFTMEYIPGQDMRRIERAAREREGWWPLPMEHVVNVIIGTCAGLHYAHEKGATDGTPLRIVHRDVSPSNIIVTYEGGIKVVDFGIAKAASGDVATVLGTLKGKIPYMSPEQCRGETLDRRSDIYAIGNLLWELTTGTTPYDTENQYEILNRIAKEDMKPPSSVVEDYPEELERIVMRALSKDPGGRYRTAREMQIDLEEFARENKLPVSSARLALFMEELFADEIRQEQGEPAEPEEDRARAEATREYTPSGSDAQIAALVDEDEPTTRRAPANLPTVVDSGIHPPDSIAPPTRFRRALIAGAITGAVLGLVAVGVAALSDDDNDDVAAEGEDRDVTPLESQVDRAKPESDQDPEPAAGEDEDKAIRISVESDDPEPRRTTKKKRRSKGKRRKSSNKSSKPKWDPDSPLPP